VLTAGNRYPAEGLFTGGQNMHVRVTSPKEQSAYLAQLDDIAVKAIVPLTDERKLYNAHGSLNDVDGGVPPVVGEDSEVDFVPANDGHGELSALDEPLTAVQSPNNSSFNSNTSIINSPPLIITLFSCMAALVGLLGVSLILYIITILRARSLASQNAWEMLPRIEKQTNDDDGHHNGSAEEDLHPPIDLTPQLREERESLLFDADMSPSGSQHTLMAAGPDKDIDTPDLITFEDTPSEDDNLSDHEGSDDFYDASSDPPTPVLDFVPKIFISHPVECHSDPPLPSLVMTRQLSLTPRAPARRLSQMHEFDSSPVSRPAWSLRAGEDASLFIPSPSSSSRSPYPSTPTPPLSPSDDTLSIAVPRRRAYRSQVPEFDIALAMQLRPGLGIGADPAWMVRFLMAMFGWFTILLTGKKERQRQLTT